MTHFPTYADNFVEYICSRAAWAPSPVKNVDFNYRILLENSNKSKKFFIDLYSFYTK